MRHLVFAIIFFIAFICAPAGFASESIEPAKAQPHTLPDQTWLLGQIVELQTKSAKLEATLLQQNANNGDLKSAQAELDRLQVQLVEVKEKLIAQAENQAKELASYDRRIGDVSWNTNMWGLILSAFGSVITVAAIALGFTAKNRAISEAREAAHNLINTESQILFLKQEELFNKQLDKHSNKFDELHRQLEIQGMLLHVQTIFDKAREFFYERNYEAALIAFEKVVDYVADLTEPRLKAFAARAFFTKGLSQGNLKQFEQEIQTYDALISYVGTDDDLILREIVAQAMFNKGFKQGLLKQIEQEIQTYDALIAYVADNKNLVLREQVAKAMYNKGFRQGQLNQYHEEAQTYDALIAYVGADKTPALRERVAKAMYSKGFRQSQLNQYHEAIQTFDALIAYVGDDKTPALREQVAWAMHCTGFRQSQLNQYHEAIQTFDALIAYVGDDKTPALREQVAMAYNGIGVALLCESKQLIQRGDVEGANALLYQALDKLEYAIRENASGIRLGNKAYALALLGQLGDFERIFAEALRAEVGGDEKLYHDALTGLNIHPIQQDEAVREIVERQWAIYQQEFKGRDE